jgi:hypothetical protein
MQTAGQVECKWVVKPMQLRKIHQTKKVTVIFGVKAHIGTNAKSVLRPHVYGITANVTDTTQVSSRCLANTTRISWHWADRHITTPLNAVLCKVNRLWSWALQLIFRKEAIGYPG